MAESLFGYRQALARVLDDDGVYSVSSATSHTVQCLALQVLDAQASPHQFDGRWVYLAVGAANAIGQQRRVRTGGFDPLTGTLTVDPPWTFTPTNGNVVHITGLFPCVSQVPSEDADYRSIINGALSLIEQPREVTTPITTSRQYVLPWQWLDRPERLLSVREPDVMGEVVMPSDWRGWRLRYGIPTPTLEVRAPFTLAVGSITLEVLQPMDTLISDGVTVSDTASGLSADTDQAFASVHDVVTIGKMLAYESLMHRSPGRPNGKWSELFEDAKTEARRLAYYSRTRERQEQAAAGPSRGGRPVSQADLAAAISTAVG